MVSFSIPASPGIYTRYETIGQQPPPVNLSVGGIVLESNRGRITPQFVSNKDRFSNLYGDVDPSLSFGMDAALDFLDESNKLWVLRVVNGATYAGLHVFQDSDENPTKTLTHSFVSGLENDFNGGGPDINLIKIDNDTVTGDEIEVEFSNGTNTQTEIVSFSGNQTSDLETFADGLQTKLDNIKTGGSFKVLPEENKNGEKYIVLFIAPPNSQVEITNLTLTGSVEASLHERVKLFDVFADNPGKWANSIGIKINNIDRGIPQIQKLTFTGEIETGDEIKVVINSETFTQTYDTSNDETLKKLADKINLGFQQNIINLGNARVEKIDNSNSNDREILITAPDAERDMEIDASITIASGNTNKQILKKETLQRVPSKDTFNLEVYSRDNVKFPINTYSVSLVEKIDGLGSQRNIVEQVNEINDDVNVSIYQPEYSKKETDKIPDYKILNESNFIEFMQGGDDGNKVNISQISNAWETFMDKDLYNIRIAINAGYTSPVVQQKMSWLAEQRKDLIAVLDIPDTKQGTIEARDYRKFELNINSSFSALYSPWLKIVDTNSNISRFIPPSGKVAATYAYTDRRFNTYTSPAGTERGRLREVRGLARNYDQGQRDILSTNQVNTIIKKPSEGFVVFDDQTLESSFTSLSFINVRRLLILLESVYRDTIDFAQFDPNNEFTRFRVEQALSNLLKQIKDNGGIEMFEVFVNEDNNPPEIRARGILVVDVVFVPVYPARRILLRTTVANTGATFEEFSPGDQ